VRKISWIGKEKKNAVNSKRDPIFKPEDLDHACKHFVADGSLSTEFF